jgi:hypothetical protein
MSVKRDSNAISVKSLLQTYTVRREHLLKFTTEHARQLHRDVADLCQRLKATPSSTCESLRIRTSKPAEFYTVFRDISSRQILGCIFGVSKIEVSPEEWERLWYA